MGFLGQLGKAFMGEPLGPNADNQTQTSQPTASDTNGGDGILDEHGRKVIPDIDVTHLRSSRSGTKIVVKAWVVNNSPDQVIRVDTTHLLQQKRQHNQEINPKSSRELTLYEGVAPMNENEHHAQIAYRLQKNGDVFQENYHIEYSLEPDGTRLVEELHDDGPVRDI